MSKIKLLFLLLTIKSYCLSLYVTPDLTHEPAVPGWEHVFAYNNSSVIPLYHYGSKSYYMGIQVKAKYMQAMQFCENIHMKLLTIRSTEENDRIQKYIREANLVSEGFWTSGSRLLDGRNWIWMSYGDGVQYTNWAPGEPNDARSQCIRLSSKDDRLYWHDGRCDESRFFICERYSTSDVGTDVYTEPTVSGWMKMLANVSSNIGLLHYKDKRYFFSKSLRTNFLQAIQFCKIIKMDLVTISSEEENDRIYKYIRDMNGDTNWWTSGTRLLDNKSWIWLTKGSHIDYTKWMSGQPDGNDEYCLQLVQLKDKGLFWQDSRCSETYNIICESTCFDNDNCGDEGPYNVGRRQGGSRKTTTTSPKVNVFTPTSPLPTLEKSMNDVHWRNQIEVTPSGFISYSYVQGYKYHMEIDLMATQAQAEFYCKYHNMKLISIYDEAENDLLVQLMTDASVPGPFWTSSRKFNGVWTWPTQSQPSSYTNWAAGKPSSGSSDKNCLEINRQGDWQDEYCYERRHFICELPGVDFRSRQAEVASRISPGGQCGSEPVVNVYISNNVITEDGKNEVSQSFLSSKDTEVSDTGYHVHVRNTIETPGSVRNNEIF